MCETRDSGIKRPQRHTLLLEAVEMGVVCTQDVKKRLLQHARMVFWKTQAAEHEWVVERRSLAGANPGHAAKKK